MGQILKTLGQSAPVAATLTPLYTVPANTQASCSTLVVCNRGAAATTFRVSVAIAGAADAVQQYIYFDVPVGANDTFVATIGISLSPADVVRVYSTLATVSFSLFGVEITP